MSCPEFAHVHEIDARDGRGGRWQVFAVVENGSYRSWSPYKSRHLLIEWCPPSKTLTLRRVEETPQ